MTDEDSADDAVEDDAESESDVAVEDDEETPVAAPGEAESPAEETATEESDPEAADEPEPEAADEPEPEAEPEATSGAEPDEEPDAESEPEQEPDADEEPEPERESTANLEREEALRGALAASLDGVAETVEVRRARRVFVSVPDKTALAEVFEALLDHDVEHLTAITGVDAGDRIDLLYHLFRHGEYVDGELGPGIDVTVRIPVTKDDPTIASLVGTIPGADLDEREVMDMLGVEFVGHPNPERLLLPDDWEEGPPMRKDDRGGE